MMDTRTDVLVPGSQTADLRQATRHNQRSAFQVVSYGIVVGPVTTAIGALASERLAGMARVVVWSGVTTVLAIGAVFLAKPGLAILGRCLRSAQNR
jgi:hypothetical protein